MSQNIHTGDKLRIPSGAYEDAQFITQSKNESGGRISRALVLKAQVCVCEMFIFSYLLMIKFQARLCLLLGTGSMLW